MIPEQYRLKNTIKYPTSLIIGGLSKLGLEIADSLIEQGGYVIVVDTYTDENVAKLEALPKDAMISFLDYTTIPNLDEEIRRLDYVFYFAHESGESVSSISTQDFLNFSNYLDSTLSLASKFDAKFLLTTSIKAHQKVLENEDLQVDYAVENSSRHKIYTNLELQRYAESLTFEYFEKVNLDSRIVRLAELIGDGIDFNKDTAFTSLVLSAALNQTLTLKKDGLETEFLVHVLDAAYGMIKAQFSQNTKGKIFSLAYEHPFTHLSVAYKIQEVEEGAQNIQFVDDKDNLPAIKLYKPAPNLTQIGWTTRVPFDKAVKQSIAAAKIFLLENQTNSQKSGSKNFVDKLKSFVDLADRGPGDAGEDLGPVSRLIAERKRQEELKKQRFEYAASTLKSKTKRRRPRTFGEKFQDWTWNQTLSLGKSFGFFKNRTPTELGFIFVSLVVLVVFYFNIFSPTIVLFREVLTLIPEYESLEVNIKSGKLSEIEGNAQRISTSAENIEGVLNRFEWLTSALRLNRNYNEVIKSLQVVKIYADGIEDVGYGVAPLQSYLNEFKNNTQVRAGTDSYLTVSNPGQDYSPILQELKTREPYINLGVDKIKKGNEEINKIDLSLLPSFLQTRINSFKKSFADNQDWANKIKGAGYLSDLLGFQQTRVYLVLLFDNTRLKPVGGELASYMLITMNKGSVGDVIIQTPADVAFDLTAMDSNTLNMINARKFTLKNAQTVNINDFGSIRDFNEYSAALKEVFQSKYQRQIDGVVALNYNTLEALIKKLSKDQKFEVNGVNFAEGSFLSNLISVQDSNESIASKYRISTRIMASLFNSMLTDLNGNLPSIMEIMDEELVKDDVLVSAENLEYSEFIEEEDLDSGAISEANAYYSVGISIDDQKLVNSNRYSDVILDTKINFNRDGGEGYELNLNFPESRTTQEISVCLPPRVPNSAISFGNFPAERVVINSLSLEKCVVFKALSESQLKLSWSITDPAATASGEYTTDVGIGKVRGTSTTAYYSLGFASPLTLVGIEPDLDIPKDSTITYTEILPGDKVWSLTLKK